MEVNMETRKFKGKDISLLGFGIMRMPEKDGKIDFDKSKEMIDEAYKNGVNYYDTAYVYHGGLSEVALGKALSEYPRESYMIADKMPPWSLNGEGDLERIFNEQLERLGVDYIDFYLLHALGRDNFNRTERYNSYDFMKKMQSEGKIRRIGFSFHDEPPVLEEILDKHDWDFVQIQFNYVDWEYINAKRMYEILAERGIPCIAMEPVKGGTLASPGKMAAEMFSAARPADSAASWAIRYAATFPNMLTVLSGMSNTEQVRDNIKTMKNFEPVTDAEKALLEKAAEEFRNKDLIPCTGCAYCINCPAGIKIPDAFKMYNDYYAVSRDINGLRTAYNKFPEETRADKCIQCGDCEALCPQSIKIRDNLSKMHGIISGK